jgi:hypothetical protein
MLNEQKITYRMKTLMESGFFGTKTLLSEAFQNKDKVRLFQAAYNYTYDKNLAVDGIKGGQTNAAIADVKTQLAKEKLDNSATEDFYYKFFEKLQNDKTINVGQGGVNTNKKLNYAIQALINLAGTPLGINGVIEAQTIAAIKTVTKSSEVITNQNILPIINMANPNVKELGVEDIATAQTAKTPEQIEAESRKAWEKYPCVAKAAGVKENKLKDGSIAYVDKDNANIYYANGRKMRLSDNVKDNYYCNGMTVTIGVMSDNTKAEGKCEEGNCVNGRGKLITAAGDTLIGAFANGKLTGADNEIFFKAFSSYFKGETKDGKMFKGAYRLKDGALYDGFFLNGKFHGDGSLYMNAFGKKWRGNFRNGAPVGSTFKILDIMPNDGKETIFPTAAMQSGANKSKFAEDMKKFKGVIDAKIKDGSLTSKNDIFSGNYSKVGNGLQILDANNNILSTTTIIPNELKETQGRWSYYTGGGGSKVMNFATANNVTKYVYTFPK